MSEPASIPWCRTAAFALLGLLWLVLGARPARAGGCHVADRPTLGLTFSWESSPGQSPSSAVQATVPVVRRPPCSEAVPGPKAPDHLSVSAWALGRLRSARPAASQLVDNAPDHRASALIAARLDRPPRGV